MQVIDKEVILEQFNHVKCHLCGAAADFAFAYARFNEREVFLGLIYRGVCKDCLRSYIEAIKQNRLPRGELLLWPMLLLPIGALFATFSKTLVVEIAGYALLSLAFIVPASLRVWQWVEAKRVREASEEENFRVYSERMCREDAQRTSRQTKLIYLRPEYAEAGISPADIAREASVEEGTAALILRLVSEARLKKRF